MLRTALLGGNSITLDADMSKYIETLSEQGVIEGLEVSSGSVAPGKAWVKATRSNGETIMVLVQNTQAQSISLNGDIFVGIELDQNAINNGNLNNEDGTGIASIKVSPSKPSQNYLVLAIRQGGRLTDQRVMIPKIQSLSQRTGTLESKLTTAEEKLERLEEAGTPQYLGKFLTVGESYRAGDVMIEQGGRLMKEIYTETINGVNNFFLNISGSGTTHRLGNVRIPQGAYIEISVNNYHHNSGNRQGGRIYIGTTDGGYEIAQVDFSSSERQTKKIAYYAETEKQVFFVLKSVSYSTNVNLENITVKINKNRSSVYLFPREIKSVDQKVECTLIGLHNNGKIIDGKLGEIIVDKRVEGTATARWTAPSNGLLCFTGSVGYGTGKIGDFSFRDTIGPREYLYVSAGQALTVSIDTGGRSGYWIHLLSFISL